MRRLISLACLLFCLASGLAATGIAAPKKKSKKETFENQFLIFGTAFTEKGFAFPGARVRVRRASEHKVRWERYSNGRGEFELWVPKGAQYEVSVSAKGWQEMTRPVDARTGDRADLVFRLEPQLGGRRK